MRVLFTLSLALLGAVPACAQDADDDDGPGRPVTQITITARRLDAARETIGPALGASVYALSNDTVEGRPGGETTTIAQVLLQAPGITQDASGQLRPRQSQGNLQYRINNVILPDGLTDPGDTLSARLAAKIELITGALPAQYGLQAGGVVSITTKDGVYQNGGQLELYGGSHATFQPAFEFGGSAGSLNYFATGQYQRSDAGLASTDGTPSPPHDATRQGEGLVYLDRHLGEHDRVALILSASDERFEIPDPRGAAAGPPLPATRRSANRFAIASLLHATDRFSLQAAVFVRGSILATDAGDAATVALYGQGRAARDSARGVGGQLDLAYEPAEAHTLRGGFTVTETLARSTANVIAHPLDAAGNSTGALVTLAEAGRVRRRIDSVYAQDEWRIDDRLTLNAGARLDHVVDAGELTRVSPRASLVWRPGPDTTLHAGYARYVLPAPIEGASESPADLARTSAALPGPAGDPLRAETDDYYAIGAQQKAGPWTLGIDAYWRRATDLLDEVTLAGTYRTAAFNYASGRIRGVELTATYTGRRVSGWANLAVGDARGRRIVSNQALFAPGVLAAAAVAPVATTTAQRVTASGGLSWRLGPVRLASDVLVGSGLPRTAVSTAPNGERLGAYAQLNASLTWRVASFHGHPLDLRLDLINLADARYRLRDGTGLVPGVAAYGPRRGVFVGIEQGF